MNKVSFSKLLSKYLSEYLPNYIGVSSNTISSYCDTFKLLLRFCRDSAGLQIEKISFEHITEKFLYEFLDWLKKERKCSASTINQRLYAIHSFIRYAQSEIPENLFQFEKILRMRPKRVTKHSISYVSEEDMRKILHSPNMSTLYGRRDMTLLSIMYDTGARVSEIVELSVHDVRLEHPAKIRLYGKGRKYRDVPILPKTVKLLENYLQEQRVNLPFKQTQPLFTNRQNQKFTRAGISYILKKYCRDIRTLNGTLVTPHVLRHSKAMHLLKAGVSVVYIKDILGHVDISTTEVYARADLEMKRKALEKLDDVSPVMQSIWKHDSNLLTWLEDFNK